MLVQMAIGLRRGIVAKDHHDAWGPMDIGSIFEIALCVIVACWLLVLALMLF